MPRDHRTAKELADEQPEVEHQTVERLPSGRDVGPNFPSGMGQVEAAMAGATAGLSDDDKDEIEYQKKLHGQDAKGGSSQPKSLENKKV